MKLKKIRLITVAIIFIILLGIVELAYSCRHILLYPLRHEVPYFKQGNALYCAEACVQMLLSFYGIRPPPQDKLAVEMSFNPNNGTDASQLHKPFARRLFRFERNWTVNFDWAHANLIQQIEIRPVILMITWDNGVGHFIVVFKGPSNEIRYHDPADEANKRIGCCELKKLWYHNCLSHPPQASCFILVIWRSVLLPLNFLDDQGRSEEPLIVVPVESLGRTEKKLH